VTCVSRDTRFRQKMAHLSYHILFRAVMYFVGRQFYFFCPMSAVIDALHRCLLNVRRTGRNNQACPQCREPYTNNQIIRIRADASQQSHEPSSPRRADRHSEIPAHYSPPSLHDDRSETSAPPTSASWVDRFSDADFEAEDESPRSRPRGTTLSVFSRCRYEVFPFAPSPSRERGRPSQQSRNYCPIHGPFPNDVSSSSHDRHHRHDRTFITPAQQTPSQWAADFNPWTTQAV
jgi:hypothetical protein